MRMKDTYIIILCCVGLWFCAGIVSAQTVSNVTAEQVGKTIHIHYDLDRAADISVYLSTNGGRSYRELHQVSGDVGLTVGPGHNTIVWDVMEEVEELIGDDIVFMVRVDGNAEARWRKKQRVEYLTDRSLCTFATLNAAYSPLPQWSYGFKVGQVKIVGWYVSAMTNFHFKGMYHPFEEGSFYDLTGRDRTARFSVEAGFVYRPIRPFSIIVGVGYGYRAYLLNTVDEKWYSYPQRTYSGVNTSLGLKFDIKGFVLTTEVSTLNFKTLEGRVGLGFSITKK